MINSSVLELFEIRPRTNNKVAFVGTLRSPPPQARRAEEVAAVEAVVCWQEVWTQWPLWVVSRSERAHDTWESP